MCQLSGRDRAVETPPELDCLSYQAVLKDVDTSTQQLSLKSFPAGTKFCTEGLLVFLFHLGVLDSPKSLCAKGAGYALGGNSLNNFSTLLSKFLMFLLELLDKVLLAEPRHSRVFVFLSKRSTTSVPTL